MKRRVLICLAVLFLSLRGLGQTESRPNKELETVLSQVESQTKRFVQTFSDVKCSEHVVQEKLGTNSKSEVRKETVYDYLVILSDDRGDLMVTESRLAVKETAQNKPLPLLVSNGFATLFLVFHPTYSSGFAFDRLPDEEVNGEHRIKIGFRHIKGRRTIAALALRGREFPLSLSGYALIDAASGAIVRIVTQVEALEDIGLKTLNSEVDFAPVRFPPSPDVFWFPKLATVEVRTPRQHWRNIHIFDNYRQFSVSTDYRVAEAKK